MYMYDSSPPIEVSGLSNFAGPAVMISNSDGLALKAYIDANAGQTVTIDTAGREQDISTYSTANGFSPALQANQVLSFSSFGPTPDGAIKPDLVATGGSDTGASGIYTA